MTLAEFEKGKVTVDLVFDKMTKNKVRYKEPGTDSDDGPSGTVFPTLYLRKEALSQMSATSPDRIRVTVELLEGD